MRVRTESGAQYEIKDSLCVKTGSNGVKHSAFRVYSMKSVPPEFTGTISDIHLLPEGIPTVGEHLFVSGRDEWWLSTKVVEIND